MKDRKKILFLSSWYPTLANPTHGIFVQRHAQAVSLLNDVLVLYFSPSVTDDSEFEVRSSAFQEIVLGLDSTPQNKISKYFFIKKQYEKVFKQIVNEWGRPDILHLNVVFPLAPVTLFLSKKYNIPLIVTEHWTGYLPEDGSYRGLLQKYLTKKVISMARAVLPVTRHLENQMKNHQLSGKYFPLPNVVDTDFFRPSEKSENSEVIFFHLSSLDERQKNPLSILEAFCGFHAQHPASRLIIAGDGDSLPALKKIAEQKGLENCTEFYFMPDKNEILRLIQRSDAMVLNSNYENLPVVLLEALSCGKPVISSNVGGISEYIQDENGILFSPPGVQGLCQAMNQFLQNKNKFDAKKIRQFALDNFSMPVIARKINNIYNSVL